LRRRDVFLPKKIAGVARKWYGLVMACNLMNQPNEPVWQANVIGYRKKFPVLL
jgi:hypothetical protein